MSEVVYPWEVLEDALRRLAVAKPAILARQLIDELDTAGWRLVKEEP